MHLIKFRETSLSKYISQFATSQMCCSIFMWLLFLTFFSVPPWTTLFECFQYVYIRCWTFQNFQLQGRAPRVWEFCFCGVLLTVTENCIIPWIPFYPSCKFYPLFVQRSSLLAWYVLSCKSVWISVCHYFKNINNEKTTCLKVCKIWWCPQKHLSYVPCLE